VIVDEKGIKDSWKEYIEKLMNEENEWDYEISAEEGPADCIRIGEVVAAVTGQLMDTPTRRLPTSGLVN